MRKKCGGCEYPGYWTCGVHGVLAHVEDGKIIGTVERCDACQRFATDAIADRYLRQALAAGKVKNSGSTVKPS